MAKATVTLKGNGQVKVMFHGDIGPMLRLHEQQIVSLKRRIDELAAVTVELVGALADSTSGKYVLLRNLTRGYNFGKCFFSKNDPSKDQTKLLDGTVAYQIIGYANSVRDAQLKLYGWSEHETDEE